MMFGAPGGVNFALVNPVTYQEAPAYSVLLRVSSAGLGELWHWLLTSSLAALLSSGVVGLSIGGRFFLWLRDPTTLTPGRYTIYYWQCMYMAVTRSSRWYIP